jgi:hypothetical protein
MPADLSAFRFTQATVEVRYQKAHRYWDDCGKVVEAIESRVHGLTCQRLGQNGFEFTGTSAAGITSATFYWDKVVITCTDTEAATLPRRFAERSEEFWRIVASGLGITHVLRLGNRFWYLSPHETLAAARQALAGRDLWNPSQSFSGWGKPSNEALRIQFEIPERQRSVVVRLGSATLTETSSGTQRFGVVFDADFFKPSSTEKAIPNPDVESFIKENLKFLNQNIGYISLDAKGL